MSPSGNPTRAKDHRGETRPKSAAKAGVSFGWGLNGARAAEPGGALVVVDVLSFSTATTIMTGRGSIVYPHAWPSDEVEAFAQARDAAWAVGRRDVSAEHPWSLSPAHLIAAPTVDRLVLPSPNGSAISAAAAAAVGSPTAATAAAGSPAARVPTAGSATGGVPAEGAVLAGCLRNASAVAAWLVDAGYGTPERPATVIAAGERWPDGELRPALEDLLGAAAIIAALDGHTVRAPEAAVAEVGWFAHRHHAAEFLRESYTGLELIGRGYDADVAVAAEYDLQDTVPVLIDGAFRATT